MVAKIVVDILDFINRKRFVPFALTVQFDDQALIGAYTDRIVYFRMPEFLKIQSVPCVVLKPLSGPPVALLIPIGAAFDVERQLFGNKVGPLACFCPNILSNKCTCILVYFVFAVIFAARVPVEEAKVFAGEEAFGVASSIDPDRESPSNKEIIRFISTIEAVAR